MFEIQKDVPLDDLNTMGLPSIAPIFANVVSIDDLIELFEDGFFSKHSPFILGGGSNVILSERLKRPVVKVSIPGVEVIREEGDVAFIRIGAGENWHNFVTWAVQKGYGGVENLALIPGTVGAAPIQNIGAYGTEIEQVFESLLAFDTRDGKLKRFQKRDCGFGYRDSVFKGKLKDLFIVTEVILRLNMQNHRINLSYSGLKEYLESKKIHQPGIREVYDAVIAIRQSKLPDPSLLGNAGSFFKNPVIESENFDQLRQKWPDIPGYPVNKHQVKVPAAWLIEQAGWKGVRSGNVGTYKNQALVIVNHGNATGKEVLEHAKLIQKSVSELFNLDLTPEVNVLSDE